MLGEASGYIFLKHGKENEAAKFPSLVRDHMCPAVGCTSAARQEVGKLEEKAVLFTLHFPTVLTTLKKIFYNLIFSNGSIHFTITSFITLFSSVLISLSTAFTK